MSGTTKGTKRHEVCQFTKQPFNCGVCEGAKNKLSAGKFHMCQSIDGPLRNWGKKQWKNATSYMTGDNGKRFTSDELKDEFFNMHNKGWTCMPVGECDKFCFKKGCMGHKKESAESAKSAVKEDC